MYRFVSSVALGAMILGGAAFALPAAAQQTYGDWHTYNTWQPGWDHGQYDRHHVMIGSVVKFSPYRLTISRPSGNVLTLDLKGGTVIHPTGTTPQPGEQIAAVGYWSNGTFIVSRLIVHG
jgi:hypothetical protein